MQRWILVIDDDADIRELIELALASRGYDVRGAADGQQALELLTSRPDAALILLDLRMPRMHGLDFLRELARRVPRTPPVVVLSGDLGASEQARGFQVIATLRKPFELRELLALVAEHVGQPRVGHHPSGGLR